MQHTMGAGWGGGERVGARPPGKSPSQNKKYVGGFFPLMMGLFLHVENVFVLRRDIFLDVSGLFVLYDGFVLLMRAFFGRALNLAEVSAGAYEHTCSGVNASGPILNAAVLSSGTRS